MHCRQRLGLEREGETGHPECGRKTMFLSGSGRAPHLCVAVQGCQIVKLLSRWKRKKERGLASGRALALLWPTPRRSAPYLVVIHKLNLIR